MNKLILRPFEWTKSSMARLLVGSVGVFAGLGACGENEDSGTRPPDAAVEPIADGGDAASSLAVSTSRGPVVGKSVGAVSAFLGIPYAAPPTGERRWRAPVDHEPWSVARDATAFGPACPQNDGGGLTQKPATIDEDCLTLNVWTPALDTNARLPVMVFIHGGAFRQGSSSVPLYDGRALASRGVVVVTMNYRLGALGFLAHRALSAEDARGVSGNYGLLDQQMALRWVRDNARSFGGAADNVTLFGESAGSISTCAQMTSPGAAGLFHRAIGESGACNLVMTRLHASADDAKPDAESLGDELAEAVGCGDAADVPTCLRSKSASDVLAAEPGGLGFGFGGPSFEPNVDGYVLPDLPAEALRTGRLNPLQAFVGGANRDEATIFTLARKVTTVEEYRAAVAAFTPAHVDDVLALYPPTDPLYSTVKEAYDAFVTDLVFVCPTRAQVKALALQGVASRLYFFTKPPARGPMSKLGVYHGSELPFVFGNLSGESGDSDADRTLSEATMGYWTRFAASGDPGGEPAWPELTPANDAYLEIGARIEAKMGLHADRCDELASWAGE